MDDESLKNLRAFSMKLYDSFEPVRQIIAECPELREPIIEALGKAMTQEFAGDFYGSKLPPEA